MSLSSAKRVSQIEALGDLSREELVEKWIKLFGVAPFKGARDVTLIRGIAYKLQERRAGGVSASTNSTLLNIATGDDVENLERNIADSKPYIKLRTGSRLIREWNGRTYEVLVTDKGFILNGVTHKSLSACAKVITGAHWSGPRFFGSAA